MDHAANAIRDRAADLLLLEPADLHGDLPGDGLGLIGGAGHLHGHQIRLPHALHLVAGAGFLDPVEPRLHAVRASTARIDGASAGLPAETDLRAAGLHDDLFGVAALVDVLRAAGRHRPHHGVVVGAIRRFIDRLADGVRLLTLLRLPDRAADRVSLLSLGRLLDIADPVVAAIAVLRLVDRLADGIAFFPAARFVYRPRDRIALFPIVRFPDRPEGGHLLLFANGFVLDAIGGVLPLFADGLIDDSIRLAVVARHTRRRGTTELRGGRSSARRQHDQDQENSSGRVHRESTLPAPRAGFVQWAKMSTRLAAGSPRPASHASAPTY